MKSIEYLKSKNIEFKIIELKEIPRSAQDVERLYGCPLHQVLKTLVLIGDREPVLVVVPGDKRVNIEKLKKVAKQNSFRMAKPDEVQNITGYSIGGVTPFGAKSNIQKVIDQSIFQEKTINIGSGKAEIGIEMSSESLRKVWDGFIADVVE